MPRNHYHTAGIMCHLMLNIHHHISTQQTYANTPTIIHLPIIYLHSHHQMAVQPHSPHHTATQLSYTYTSTIKLQHSTITCQNKIHHMSTKPPVYFSKYTNSWYHTPSHPPSYSRMPSHPIVRYPHYNMASINVQLHKLHV